MESKILTGVACALVLFQTISAQCRGNRLAPLAYAPEFPRANSFAVQSTSPIAPTGVTILSDQLVIEGPLVIDGQLPFLGTVAVEGAVPSGGVGSVAHSCGGPVGIISEGPASPVIAGASISPVIFGAGAPALNYGAPGLGTRRMY